MKSYKAIVFLDTGGDILTVDTIEYKGSFWLVPGWLVAQDGSGQTPHYMIQLDSIRHQRQIGNPVADFVVEEPIPKSVFLGQGSAPGFVVEVLPGIQPPPQSKPH